MSVKSFNRHVNKEQKPHYNNYVKVCPGVSCVLCIAREKKYGELRTQSSKLQVLKCKYNKNNSISTQTNKKLELLIKYVGVRKCNPTFLAAIDDASKSDHS